MTSGDRQRRDGSLKRVQLTAGDHAGPKGKRSKGKIRTMKPTRAAQLRELKRFLEAHQESERRRRSRKG